MDDMSHHRAQFHAMTESTYDEWQLIGGELERFAKRLPERLIAHLDLLRGDYGGFPIDRLEHCLQTATRAFQAGRDDENIQTALQTSDVSGNVAGQNPGLAGRFQRYIPM